MYKTAKRSKNHYDLQSDLNRIKNAFADTASHVRGRAGDLVSSSLNNIKDKTIEVQENVADYTSEKPFTSLGFALLAGLALGFIMTHRRKARYK